MEHNTTVALATPEKQIDSRPEPGIKTLVFNRLKGDMSDNEVYKLVFENKSDAKAELESLIEAKSESLDRNKSALSNLRQQIHSLSIDEGVLRVIVATKIEELDLLHERRHHLEEEETKKWERMRSNLFSTRTAALTAPHVERGIAALHVETVSTNPSQPSMMSPLLTRYMVSSTAFCLMRLPVASSITEALSNNCLIVKNGIGTMLEELRTQRESVVLFFRNDVNFYGTVRLLSPFSMDVITRYKERNPRFTSAVKDYGGFDVEWILDRSIPVGYDELKTEILTSSGVFGGFSKVPSCVVLSESVGYRMMHAFESDEAIQSEST